MRKVVETALLFGFLQITINAKFEEYLTISVKADCGADVDSQASLNVVADFNVVPMVRCKDSYVQELTTTDDIHYNGTAAYSGDSRATCVFKEKQGIYTLDVVIGKMGRSGVWIRTRRDIYGITCTFGKIDEEKSMNETIDDSKAPMEVAMENHGGNVTTPIVLEVMDVLGNVITEVIPVGKTIKLRGEIKYEVNVTGLRPINCEASNADRIYPILLAGCGEGLIFSKTTGFKTTGLEMQSPYFKAFRLEGGTKMIFRCHFVACHATGGCDGMNQYLAPPQPKLCLGRYPLSTNFFRTTSYRDKPKLQRDLEGYIL